jgi:hypothetical protein
MEMFESFDEQKSGRDGAITKQLATGNRGNRVCEVTRFMVEKVIRPCKQ